MDSDPAKPLAISFDDDIAPAVTDPEPVPTPKFALPRRAPARASASARLAAWLVDATCISALTAACVALTLHKAHIQYPFDFLRDTAVLWAALLLLFAFAWSMVFALIGQTPGMALAGHRVRSLYGGPPTPAEAIARALLSLISAGLGMFGFLLALVDARGQTLHDKLCRCIVLTGPAHRR
jgi:uncharacterized RDD family membrane protein YckC